MYITTQSWSNFLFALSSIIDVQTVPLYERDKKHLTFSLRMETITVLYLMVYINTIKSTYVVIERLDATDKQFNV